MKVNINQLVKVRGGLQRAGAVQVPCEIVSVYGENPALHPNFVEVKLLADEPALPKSFRPHKAGQTLHVLKSEVTQ